MTDITTVKHGRRDLKEALLDPNMAAVFQALVPQHMRPDRMLRLAISCITRTPKLLEVPQVQVLGALVQCASIGLEPNSPLQHAHLIPFENRKQKRYELQTIIGYRGFVELGRRTGKQTWVHGDVVRPGDEFSYAYGNEAHLKHRPGRGTSEREAPTDAYCFVQLTDGFAFVVLPEWEVLRHRGYSFAWRTKGADSPWGEHPDRMWRKTAIRVLYSGGEVPLDTELAMAVATDDQRMDYRAMGELALKGGKSAIEHLKEGMDTFVSEVAEEEPEPHEERVVEIRSQVRPSAPASEPPAQTERQPKRGRPTKAEQERRLAEQAAQEPEPTRYNPETGEVEPEAGDGSDDADDGGDDWQAWLSDAKSMIRGWPSIAQLKQYAPAMIAESEQFGEEQAAEFRGVLEAKFGADVVAGLGR